MRSILSLALYLFGSTSIMADEDSLQRLMDGNLRYVSGKTINEKQFQNRREELLTSQTPFATIVGCSDSRVPPEIVFDQSLGDLFVVRVAGNVVGPIEMDSIEFASDQLRSPLIFVLGHQGCGAVRALLDQPDDPDLIHVAPQIQEAIEDSKNIPGDRWMNAIKANIRLSMKLLEQNPVLQNLIQSGQLEIRGGYYELKSGKVRLLKQDFESSSK